MADTGLAAGLAKLRDNAKQVGPDYERQLNEEILQAAIDGEAYMKEHAPWRDDTGNRKDRVPGAARAGLHTVPDIEGEQKEILFSHSVSYGIWLETKHSGKDEIIMPSVKHIGDKIMQNSEGSLDATSKRGFIGTIGEIKGEQGILNAPDD